MSMLEAECTRCHQIFVPHGTDPEDLIHAFTEVGSGLLLDDVEEVECGGIGVILGEWVPPTGSPERLLENEDITKQEWHGIESPHCRGKHCVHHHPELIKLNS